MPDACTLNMSISVRQPTVHARLSEVRFFPMVLKKKIYKCYLMIIA
jgi:hypothetical protein